MTPRELAQELLDTLEHDCGELVGDKPMFEALVVLVEQAITDGWEPLAEEVVTLAIGESEERHRLCLKHSSLQVIDAQLCFMFEATPED